MQPRTRTTSKILLFKRKTLFFTFERPKEKLTHVVPSQLSQGDFFFDFCLMILLFSFWVKGVPFWVPSFRINKSLDSKCSTS